MMRQQRGVSLVEAMILLILLTGFIGLFVLEVKLKAIQTSQTSAVSTQAREMATIARAGFSYFLTDGRTLAPGTRGEVTVDTLIAEEYLPGKYAYRQSNRATAPTGQPYRVVGYAGTGGGLEVMVYASGPMLDGALSRLNAKNTEQGRQAYGLSVIKALSNDGVTSGWAKIGATRTDVSATSLDKDLSLLLAPSTVLDGDTVVLVTGVANAASVVTVEEPAKPDSTCRIATGTSTCNVGERVVATFSACQGQGTNGAFTESTISTPVGDLKWQQGTQQMSPAAASCPSGTCSNCSIPSGGNCTGWSTGQGGWRTPEVAPGGSTVPAPYSNSSGWMNWDRQITTTFGGQPVINEVCSKLKVTNGAGAAPVKTTLTVGPSTSGAGTNALCCT